jgi:LAO/AO transport system kinase
VLSLDKDRAWKVPIVLTEAHRGENVPELWEKVEKHRSFLEREGLLEERRRRNLAGEVYAVASARARVHLQQTVEADPELRAVIDEVQARRLDPLSAVSVIMSRVFRIESDDAGTR